MDLVVELISIVVVQVAHPIEGVVRRTVVFDQEVAVLTTVAMVKQPVTNVDVRTADVPRNSLSVGKQVDPGPALSRVTLDRNVSEGPPTGHRIGRRAKRI